MMKSTRLSRSRSPSFPHFSLPTTHISHLLLLRSFVSDWDRKKHVRAVHDKIRVVCPYEGCGTTFTAESAKSKHVLTAHMGIRVPCASPGCLMTFYDRKAMRTHCNNKHGITFY